MKKRMIALFLTLVMILMHANLSEIVAYADTAEVEYQYEELSDQKLYINGCIVLSKWTYCYYNTSENPDEMMKEFVRLKTIEVPEEQESMIEISDANDNQWYIWANELGTVTVTATYDKLDGSGEGTMEFKIHIIDYEFSFSSWRVDTDPNNYYILWGETAELKVEVFGYELNEETGGSKKITFESGYRIELANEDNEYIEKVEYGDPYVEENDVNNNLFYQNVKVTLVEGTEDGVNIPLFFTITNDDQEWTSNNFSLIARDEYYDVEFDKEELETFQNLMIGQEMTLHPEFVKKSVYGDTDVSDITPQIKLGYDYAEDLEVIVDNENFELDVKRLSTESSRIYFHVNFQEGSVTKDLRYDQQTLDELVSSKTVSKEIGEKNTFTLEDTTSLQYLDGWTTTWEAGANVNVDGTSTEIIFDSSYLDTSVNGSVTLAANLAEDYGLEAPQNIWIDVDVIYNEDVLYSGRIYCKLVDSTDCEHTWRTYVILEANCTEDGERLYSCSNCYMRKYEPIPADGVTHNYSAYYTTDVAATETTTGIKSLHCKNTGCTARTDITEIPKTGDTSTVAPTVAPQESVTVKLYGHDDIEVNWSSQAVEGCEVKYKVEYMVYGGSYETLTEAETGTSLKKANLADGKKYRFRVTPYVTVNGTNYYGDAKVSAYIYTLKKLSVPTVVKASDTTVKVSWTNIAGETGYQISGSTSKTGTNIVATYATTSGTSKVITPKKQNTTYYYKVRAYKTVGDTKVYGPWSDVTAYNLRYVYPVTDVKAVLYGYDDVKVTWTKAAGANAYAVYYKKSTASSYTYYKTVTGTTCKKADLADGVKYTFKVVPQYKVDGKVKLKGTADTATVTTLKKLSAPTVTKYSSTKVKVKWTNIADETGYQISRSTSKTKTNIVVTYATTSGTYKTITPPKTNTTYYYKVRAYKTVDGTKIFGPWSAVTAFNLK